jgi:hypothetical protein
MVKCVGEWVYGRKGTSLRRKSVTRTCGGGVKGRNKKKKKKLERKDVQKKYVAKCR